MKDNYLQEYIKALMANNPAGFSQYDYDMTQQQDIIEMVKQLSQPTMQNITMDPPVYVNESAFITTLWGVPMLNAALNEKQRGESLEDYLIRTLLPRHAVQWNKMEPMNGKSHKSIIISALEIKDKDVDTESRTITIPISAFHGKSLIALQTQVDDDGTRYYYILLQSAKDPNILQPIRVSVGPRTGKLITNLTSHDLRENHGWEVRIQDPHKLIQYIHHYENDPTNMGKPVQISRLQSPLGIQSKISPNIQYGEIGRTPQTYQSYQSELEKLLKGWGTTGSGGFV